MRKRFLQVPADVATIIFKLGTTPHPSLSTLSPEEEIQAADARQADYARVKATIGDFVGAVRDGVYDDGQQLIAGDPLYTGECADQLESFGYRFIDAYTTNVVKDGKTKYQVVAIFSKVGDPTARATDEAKEVVKGHLTFNWFKTYVWHNPHREVPNMTINAFGVLRQGRPENLQLVNSNVAADQPA